MTRTNLVIPDLTEEEHWKLYPGVPAKGCAMNKCENPDRRLPHCEGCSHLNNESEIEKRIKRETERQAKMYPNLWVSYSPSGENKVVRKNINSSVFDDFDADIDEPIEEPVINDIVEEDSWYR